MTVRTRLRAREIALLAAVAVAVLALGWITARDLRRSANDADRLYQRLSRSVDVIDALQFATQETRRLVLYPLHTSDANLQLQYVEQSRESAAAVAALITRAEAVADAPRSQDSIRRIERAWTRYLAVRDEVIGLILEGALPDAVALDIRDANDRFNEVRAGIADLKTAFAQDAAVQVATARSRATAATTRLIILVVIALGAAVVGISHVSRRAALESLLRIEAHKGSILEAVPDPIFSTDAVGRVVELNHAAEQAFGLSRASTVGAFVEDIILPPEQRGVLRRMLGAARGRSRVVWPRLTVTGRRQDGSEFPMEIAAVSHTAGGERVWTLHLSDRTERQRTEEQLRRAKDAAEAADRAKSDFLATVTHELRTPLVGVVGVADLLQDAGGPSSQRDLLAMLRSSATALLSLVSDILDYSRIEAGLLDLKPVAFDIRECIEDTFDAVTELAARKGLDLGYVVSDEVPERVVADQARVRQVLLNLVSNAVKFTDAGGVSVVVTCETPEPDTYLVRANVHDTGIGIPEHLHGQLIQRFSRIPTAGKQPGTGLGLAISERLSRLLGGALSLQSGAARGTTFRFSFRADAAAAAPEARPADRPLDGQRILVLGRSAIVTRQLEAMLGRWGAAVRVATSPDVIDAAEGWNAVIADADSFNGGVAAVDSVLADAIAPAPLLHVTRSRNHTAEPERRSRVINKPLKIRPLRAALESCGVAACQPVAEEDRVPPRRAFAPDALRILLVEDNDANRRVLEMMVRELGLRADVAADGIEAVEAARTHDYDVILMDLQMPGLDGFEATRQIRRARPGGRPTIIALTAGAVGGEQARCRDAGMDGYLPKPIRLEALAVTLLPLTTRRPA